MTTTPSGANPFIGPRSFETGERLYGRDREVRDLLHLLIAERVVLLYSPSGAGKSSLIKAALIPALEKKDFKALPSIRVNQELPPGAPPEANRYVYSTLLSLEERFGPEERLDEAALAAFGLAGYLQERLLPPVRAAGRDPVLLFDQFEEVLTADPTNLEAKHAFFAQLGQALSDRQVWALFAMREDYLAALDPYLVPVPNRFKDTFRLDLLGVDAARLAMQGPARAAGVTFSGEAAARLADDLRRTRVQQPDGTSAEVLGPYVEPVQLQVVCLRLWERRFAADAPTREPLITPEDITDVGDVDSALAGYYTDRVQAVAAASGVKERTIRDWFDGELITPQGQRSQVMREPGSSAGLDNRAVMGLIDAHLVRGDERHGTVWFELAHDRLVAPIRQNNAAWRLQTLTAFQRQAILWEEQGRGEGLLLQGAELAEGEQWAAANAAELTEGERAFLDASRKAQAIREQQERANRHIRQALIGTVVAALVAIGLAAVAYLQSQVAQQQSQRAEEQALVAQRERQHAEEQARIAQQQRRRAEEQARIALLRAFAAQSLDARERAPERSLLLAAATQAMPVAADLRWSVGLNALLHGLQLKGSRSLRGHDAALNALAFSPDGRTLATASNDHTARLWRLDAPGAAPTVLSGHEGAVTTLAFSPDGQTLATGSEDNTVRLWKLGAPSTLPTALRGHTDTVTILAFSPDGRTLATGSKDATARLWRLDDPTSEPVVLSGHEGMLRALAFSPDGQTLATAGDDATARLWRLDAPASEPVVLSGHEDAIWALAFSPDGQTLATGSYDATARLWRLDAPAGEPVVLSGHEDRIFSLAFSPDGQTLATASIDGTARLWPLNAPDARPTVLRGHESGLSQLAFSPDGQTLATGSYDNTVRLWRLDDPDARPTILRGHEAWIVSLVFSPDGRTLATASNDGTARLWPLGAPDLLPGALSGQEAPITVLAFSPDGQSLASGGEDGAVYLWPLDAPALSPAELGRHEGMVTTIAFSPDGGALVTGGDDGAARLWRLDAPTAPPVVLEGHEPGNTTVAFSPDGRFLATGSVSNTVRLWRLDTPDAPPRVLSGHTGTIMTLAFSPDGRTLATGSEDSTARLWRLDTPDAAPTVLSGHTGTITWLAFRPDGRTLATGSEDGSARLWPLADPANPTALIGHWGLITMLAFSPDGRTLGTSSDDGTVRLWRVETPAAPPAVLSGHTSSVGVLAFSADGRTLATGSNDTTTRLWRLDAPSTPPIVLSTDQDALTAVAFSPDGRGLVTSSWDGTARLWKLDSAELVRMACTNAGRNLALGEWRQLNDPATPYAKTCPWLARHPSVYEELLAHGQFDLALMGDQEDRSAGDVAEEPGAWLIRQAALLDDEAPIQSLLTYLLARWREPQLRGASPADLATLCKLGAGRLPTPALLDACDQALASDAENLSAAYARAQLRAQLGDTTGALADLQAAQRLAQEQRREDTLKDIQRWLGDLQAGRDPLRPASAPASP